MSNWAEPDLSFRTELWAELWAQAQLSFSIEPLSRTFQYVLPKSSIFKLSILEIACWITRALLFMPVLVYYPVIVKIKGNNVRVNIKLNSKTIKAIGFVEWSWNEPYLHLIYVPFNFDTLLGSMGSKSPAQRSGQFSELGSAQLSSKLLGSCWTLILT